MKRSSTPRARQASGVMRTDSATSRWNRASISAANSGPSTTALTS
ncbi:hypothetical protein WJ971_26910 [Achromobacter xylosoxidans]